MLPRLKCLPLLRRGCLSLEQLKQIHAQMITGGIYKQVFAMDKLVECCTISARTPEDMDYARLVFRHAAKPETFTWNFMIRCAATLEETISLYTQLLPTNTPDDNNRSRNKLTFNLVISACTRSAAALEGKQIHAQVTKTRFASDVAVQTTLMHFYASCKDINLARQLFDKMPVKNAITWNAMIAGYSSQGSGSGHRGTHDQCRYYYCAKEALSLFCDMLLLGREMEPTDTTAVAVISACSRLGDLATGSCVHAYIHKTIPDSDTDLFVGTGLVDMYSKCGCIDSARKVFERMTELNVLTWSAMIAGLGFHGRGKEALELLNQMQSWGVSPNAVTFTCLLCACSHAGLVEEGLRVFDSMSSTFGVDSRIEHYGCVVDMLGRAGLLKEAYEFIIGMPIEPDLVLWRTLLAACRVHGNVEVGDKVGKIIIRLGKDGTSETQRARTSQDYIALSNVYASAKRWEDVERVRETMKSKGIRNRAGYSWVSCT